MRHGREIGRTFGIVVLALVAMPREAAAEDCSRYHALKLQAAQASNLALLYQLDAQERQCYANRGRTVAPPSYAPPPMPPQRANTVPERIQRALNELGKKTMAGQPLRQDIPLSAGVVRQEIYVPPPPTGYTDPFAPGRGTTPTPASKPYVPGSNNCPRGMRMRVSGNLSYCELDPSAN